MIAETGFEHIDDALCRSFQTHLEVIGRKWNSGIMLASVRGARRFSEYRAMVDGISDRLLAQRLRELESERFIERRVTPTTPVLVEYRPTERGRELLRILEPLAHWSITYN
jgi:DNA-binding HxlR family transcriptional regulator